MKDSLSRIFKKNKRFLLILPYGLITLLLVIIPLILIFLKSFIPVVSGLNVSENWNFIDGTIWQKIGLSFLVAFGTSFFCFIFGYTFAYFLSFTKSVSGKVLAIALMTSPMWISMLVKMVGLKTLFDSINGEPNSTYGAIFSLIALVYINLPTFILTIYTFINSIPKNLLQASKDLGKNSFQTLFYVIIPYTKNAIISGLILVFLPSLTTAGVSAFIDNSNSGSLIGEELLDQGLAASVNPISLARISTLSLIICFIIFILLVIFVIIPKSIKTYKKNQSFFKNSKKTSSKRTDNISSLSNYGVKDE